MTDAENAGLGSLEKVRDILVGTQMREVSKKLSVLEDAIERRLNRVKDEFRKAMANLEKSTKKELSALSESLKAERHAAVVRTKELENTLQARFGALEDGSTAAVQGLRDEMGQLMGALGDELRGELEESKGKATRDAGDLRETKVGRDDLAALLVDVAGRLNGHGRKRGRA